MHNLLPKTSAFVGRTLLAGIALILLVAGTVHCDQKQEASKDKLDRKVEDIRNQYDNVSTCAMCGKEAIGKTVCLINVDAGVQVKTCCARCGVLMLKRLGYQKSGSTIGYSTGERVDLRKAFFVVGSDVKTCCEPSVLAFVSREEAEKFVAEHHGEIKQFKDM